MSYQSVIDRVHAAAAESGRSPADVTLVAVSKGKTVEDIIGVYDQGHRDFGENRAQELAEKAPQLPDDIRWHFVGTLQSNKVRLVRSITHLLHSLDRPSLASAWVKGPGKAPPVLVQVNLGDESQKSGVAVGEVEKTVSLAAELGLVVRGVMAVPPAPERPEDSRRYFAELRGIGERVAKVRPSATIVSMGMTDDFEVAIDEGATMIRVGRAIFGPRDASLK